VRNGRRGILVDISMEGQKYEEQIRSEQFWIDYGEGGQ